LVLRVLSILSLVSVLIGCTEVYLPGEKGVVDVIPVYFANGLPQRNIEVYKPPRYNPNVAHPVIYLHDGQNVFNPATAYTGVDWGVDEALDSLIKGGFIPPVIAVAIHNTKYRWNEYLPEPCFTNQLDSGRLMPYARQSIWDTVVYSSKYLECIVKDIKPLIDETYTTDTSQTYIMGSSMGGLISLYALTEYPETFQGAACLSTHWPALDGACIQPLLNVLAVDDYHKYYFDRGTVGLDSLYEPYQNKVDSAFNAKQGYFKIAHKSEVFVGGDHNEASWRKRVAIPLVFLLSDIEAKNL
jgi:hypothetical protein